jgi:hypothetical protein
MHCQLTLYEYATGELSATDWSHRPFWVVLTLAEVAYGPAELVVVSASDVPAAAATIRHAARH